MAETLPEPTSNPQIYLNQIQTAYVEAKTREKLADIQRIETEQAFIKTRGIRNQDGTVPTQLEDLDLADDPEAEKAWRLIDEFWAMAPNPALEGLINQTRNDRVKAEDELITWGLSQMPADKAEILRPRLEKIAVDRIKALKLFMKLRLGASHGK